MKFALFVASALLGRHSNRFRCVFMGICFHYSLQEVHLWVQAWMLDEKTTCPQSKAEIYILCGIIMPDSCILLEAMFVCIYTNEGYMFASCICELPLGAVSKRIRPQVKVRGSSVLKGLKERTSKRALHSIINTSAAFFLQLSQN